MMPSNEEILAMADSLGHQSQVDSDGTLCGVSRQAVDETISMLRAIAAERTRPAGEAVPIGLLRIDLDRWNISGIHSAIEAAQLPSDHYDVYLHPPAQQAAPMGDAGEWSEWSTRQRYVNADGCPTELAVLKRFWREHQAAQPSVPVDVEEVATSLGDDAELVRDKIGRDSEVAENMERAADIIFSLIAEHAAKGNAG